MLSLRNWSVTRTVIAFGFVSVVVLAVPAFAVDLNWDPTLSGSTFYGGSGTWDVSTTANWYDGATDIQWTDTTGATDTAILAGAQGGTVTIGSNPLGALGLQFGTPGYTVAGTQLTLGTGGITVNSTVPGASTVSAPISLVGSQAWTVGGASTLVAGGVISGSDTLTRGGNGMLTINGANTSFTGGTTLNAGGRLNIGHADALGTGAGILNFSGTSSFDNTSGSAITLPGNRAITIGNAVITFVGSSDLNLGDGSVTSGASRTIVARRNNLTIGGAIDLQAAGRNLTKQGAGILTLTSAAHYFDQTLIQGGTIDLRTTGQLPQGFGGGVPQQLTLNNGELRMSGTNAGNRSQVVGPLAVLGGRDTVSLAADPASNTMLTADSIGARGIYATMLFRGTNLGTTAFSTPTAGTSNIVFTTAPTASNVAAAATTYGALGTDTPNTPDKAIFRGGLYDSSPTGPGTGFATYDTANGVRALNSSEQTTAYPVAASVDNVRLDLAGATAITGVQSNSLQLNNASGSPQIVTNTGTALNPVNGLLFSGDSPITLTGGSLTHTTAAAGDGVILSTNTAGVTIETTLAVAGTGERGWTFGGPGNITVTGGITGAASFGAAAINGPGTVMLDAPVSVSSKGVLVQGGTLKLGPNFSMSSNRSWKVADGAVLDVNGKSMTANLEGLASNDIAGSSNGAGGTIINSSATPVTLTFTPASGNRSSGAVVTGDVSLILAATGASNQTLTGQSSYSGTTTINSGTMILGAHNTLPVTTPLAVNGHASLGAVLNMNGFSQTVRSLSGTTDAVPGNIQNNSAANASSLTINGTTSTTYSGVLGGGAGMMSLVKAGSGTQTFAGANTYTGTTLVNGGVLAVNGTHTGGGAYTVNPGGTLGGNGSITTNNANVVVTTGGSLAPGASAGTLTFDLGTGGLNLAGVNSGGFKFELDTPAASDKVVISNASTALDLGTLDFSDFTFTNLGGVTANTDYVLFDALSAFTATLGTASGTFGGFNAMLQLDKTTNFDVVLKVGTALANLGDFNNDGKVDAADYVVWREAIGTQVKYDEWRANFGNMYFGSSTASLVAGNGNSAVPEPSTCLSFVVLSALVAIVRRRRCGAAAA